MDTPAPNSDNEMEELVLKESIVSATGMDPGRLQIGIRGDPSMRETSMSRQRYASAIDGVLDQLLPNLQELLLGRSTLRVYVGFNSGEVRTTSIFDPLREEVHEGVKVADHTYLERHFPPVDFDTKAQAMRDLYAYLRGSRLYDLLPSYWRNIITKRGERWQPMDPAQIPEIIASLKVLRGMEDYYLRNVTICIVQDVVRMQFNCDGTQIVCADVYKQFIEDNVP